MSRKFTSSIHRKIFMSTYAIVVCAIFIIVIFTSGIFYKSYLNLQINSSFDQLTYISDQLSFYLSSITNYARTLCVNNDIQHNIVSYNLDKQSFNALDQMKITSEINQIIQSTPIVHSVSIFSTEKEKISSTTSYTSQTSVKDLQLNNGFIWFVQNIDQPGRSSIQEPVLSLFQSFYRTTTGSPIGYLEISMPETAIADIYRTSIDDSNNIYLTDASGVIQSSCNLPLKSSCALSSLMPFTEKTGSFFKDGKIVFYHEVPTLNWYVIKEVNLLKFLQPTFIALGISVIAGILLTAACFFLSFKISADITEPINRLIGHTKTVKKGHWTTIEETGLAGSDIRHLYEAFNSMLIAQEKLKNDLMTSEKAKSKISLDLLQQQVNPHFLYNTLDNICSLAEINEKEKLIDLVVNLSSFYRRALSNGKFYITVGEELAITKAYLHIMQIRYYQKFDFHISCDNSLLHYTCIKLLLQPIVENSIYHGIKELEERGTISITVTGQGDYIHFCIVDNGIGLGPEEIKHLWQADSNHFGVKNIHQRIQLYYGVDCGLSIEGCQENGCRVNILIKKQENYPHAT